MLRRMKRVRAIVALLLCVVLPHAATAALLQGYACQHMHHGAADAITHAHEHAHEHGRDARHDDRHHGVTAHHATDVAPDVAVDAAAGAVAAVAGSPCADCRVKCVCGHHCTSGSTATLLPATQKMHLASRAVGLSASLHVQSTSELHRRSLLRPPIQAPLGAV